MSLSRPLRRSSISALAVLAFTTSSWAASPASAWVHHEGSSVGNVALSSTGTFSFTVTNPTTDTIRCSVNLYTEEAETEIRAGIARVNEAAPAYLEGDDIDAILEMTDALSDLSPESGQIQYTNIGINVSAQSSQNFSGRLDAPIQDRYVGYALCDNYSTAPEVDMDATVLVATKDTTSGGGAFGSLEQLFP